MRRLEVEVVAWPVEVRRQEEDRVEAVLLAIRLGAHEDCLLRDAVRRVRLLRVAVPEIVLAERHRCELRVRAHRSDDDELRRRVEARLLEDIRSHRDVREPVAAGVRSVRTDPADLGGEVEHQLRAGLVEQPRGLVHRREVVIGASRGEHVVSLGLETLDEVRAEEATAACDQSAHRRRVPRSSASAHGLRCRSEVDRRPARATAGRSARSLPWRRFTSGSRRRIPPGSSATRRRSPTTHTRSRRRAATSTARASRSTSRPSSTTRARSSSTASPGCSW